MYQLHRRWKTDVLTEWERHTSTLHAIAKRPGVIAPHKPRALIYYGFVLLAILYLWLLYRIPSDLRPDAVVFEGCRRGLQFATAGNVAHIPRSLTTVSADDEEEEGDEKDVVQRGDMRVGEAKPIQADGLRRLDATEGAEVVPVDYAPLSLPEPMELMMAPGHRALKDAQLAQYTPYYHFQGFFLPAVQPPTARFRGRGIVLAASGRIMGQAIGAYVTAYILRRVLNCRLPIEIFYVGPQEMFGTKLHSKLKDLGDVKISNLPTVLQKDAYYRDQLRHLHVLDRRLRSYAAKPYAVYASSFREVILLDAGVIPFVDPETFFDFDGYTHYGYQMFRDYRELDKRGWSFVEKEFCADLDEMYELLGGTEADSSCLIMDKQRVWDSLLVTMAMNGPLQHSTYKRLNGDKDTWVLASSITYQNFSTTPTTPGYLMRGAEPGLTLLDQAYHGLAQPLRGHVQFARDEAAPGGVVPLYLNNQCLNFTEYPLLRDRLSFGLWEDYGYPFCGWRVVNPLLKLPSGVYTVLDEVTNALRAVDAAQECLCKWFRCRWPSPFSPDWPMRLRR